MSATIPYTPPTKADVEAKSQTSYPELQKLYLNQTLSRVKKKAKIKQFQRKKEKEDRIFFQAASIMRNAFIAAGIDSRQFSTR